MKRGMASALGTMIVLLFTLAEETTAQVVVRDSVRITRIPLSGVRPKLEKQPTGTTLILQDGVVSGFVMPRSGLLQVYYNFAERLDWYLPPWASLINFLEEDGQTKINPNAGALHISKFVTTESLSDADGNLDTENFKIHVEEAGVTDDIVAANLASFNADGGSLSELQNLTLTRTPSTNEFVSRFLRLVSNAVDDGAAGGGAEAVANQTLLAEAGGRIRMTYTAGSGEEIEKEIAVCMSSEIKKVKLNIISMKGNDGTFTYWYPEEIVDEIAKMQRAWGQCCIRFVDQNGGEITLEDVVEREQPLNLDLDDQCDAAKTATNLPY